MSAPTTIAPLCLQVQSSESNSLITSSNPIVRNKEHSTGASSSFQDTNDINTNLHSSPHHDSTSLYPATTSCLNPPPLDNHIQMSDKHQDDTFCAVDQQSKTFSSSSNNLDSLFANIENTACNNQLEEHPSQRNDTSSSNTLSHTQNAVPAEDVTQDGVDVDWDKWVQDVKPPHQTQEVSDEHSELIGKVNWKPVETTSKVQSVLDLPSMESAHPYTLRAFQNVCSRVGNIARQGRYSYYSLFPPHSPYEIESPFIDEESEIGWEDFATAYIQAKHLEFFFHSQEGSKYIKTGKVNPNSTFAANNSLVGRTTHLDFRPLKSIFHWAMEEELGKLEKRKDVITNQGGVGQGQGV